MNSRKGFVKNVCKRLNADFNEPTGTLKKIVMSLQRCYKYKNLKKIKKNMSNKICKIVITFHQRLKMKIVKNLYRHELN